MVLIKKVVGRWRHDDGILITCIIDIKQFISCCVIETEIVEIEHIGFDDVVTDDEFGKGD